MKTLVSATLDPESTTQVSFRFTNRDKANLSELGRRTGWTMSKLMNLMIRGATEMATRRAYVTALPEPIANIRTQLENYKEEYNAKKLIADGKAPVSIAIFSNKLQELTHRIEAMESKGKEQTK